MTISDERFTALLAELLEFIRIPSVSADPACATQVRAAADAYRVFYERREQTGGYTMDHSLTVYLMNPEGEFVTPLSYGMGPERTATAIRRAMEEAAA